MSHTFFVKLQFHLWNSIYHIEFLLSVELYNCLYFAKFSLHFRNANSIEHISLMLLVGPCYAKYVNLLL